MRAKTLVTLILLASMTAPLVASGPSGPVSACERQCHPLSADVNGHTPRTGNEASFGILYPHFQDILNRNAMNLQRPDPAFEYDLNEGKILPTVVLETGTPVYSHFQSNWFYAFVSPGPVEFDEQGNWQTHQEPGLADDIHVVGDTMNLYVYVSANAVPGGNSDTFPGNALNVDVMPQVAVYARLETGRYDFSIQSTLIAEGDTGAGDIAGLIGGPDRATIISIPGQPDIYEILVPMKVLSPVIPGIRSPGPPGALLSINVYQLDTGQGADENVAVTQADWRWHTGPKTPPHLVFEQTEALRSVSADVAKSPGGADIVWNFLSPWGSYDFDATSVTATLLDRDGNAIKSLPSTRIGQAPDGSHEHHHAHDQHFQPVTATWTLDASDLHGQESSVKLEVLNLQQTYRLETVVLL